ncbi:MAG: hypothetical protein QXG02_04210, partial [Candidatus Anstonellales archaeon]
SGNMAFNSNIRVLDANALKPIEYMLKAVIKAGKNDFVEGEIFCKGINITLIYYVTNELVTLLQRTNAEEINMKLISHTLNEAEISISGKVVKHAVGISHSKTDPAKIVIVLIPILKNSEN